ncbi:MAG: hypothetical protein KGY99_05090 [Phycisphaerae bacterium]|nr:hypothetical protein [Phycisphaerae bacterium]
MAQKEQLSAVVQHVEKGVLGICVLMLLILALTSIGSPTVQLNGNEVELAKLDDALLRAAEQRVETARNATLGKWEQPKLANELVAARDNPLRRGLLAAWPDTAVAAPLQRLPAGPAYPDLPVIARVEPIDVASGPDLATLKAHTPTPHLPLVKVTRELRSLPEESERPAEKIVAHVAATYPMMQLLRQWREDLSETDVRARFAVAAVRAQRSRQQLDGTWSEPETIQTVAQLSRQPLGPAPPPEQVIPPFDGTEATRRTVRTAMDRHSVFAEFQQFVREEGEQPVRRLVAVLPQQGSTDAILNILQPSYPDIYEPITGQWTTWLIHLPETPLSRAERERIEAEATGDGDGTPARRTAPRTIRRSTTPRRTPRYGPSAPPTPEGYPGAGRPGLPPESYAPPPERRRPSRDPRSPERPRRPEQPEAEGPAPTVVPDLTRQFDDGKVLIWFHDTDGLDAGTTYRWRYQLMLANPLLTYNGPGEARNREDARQQFIETDWSAWTTPTATPNVADIFVTGGSATMQQVYVTVFRQVLGQTVMQVFSAAAGQQIGRPETVELLNPLTNERVRREVDFATGAVVLARDLDKPLRYQGTTRNTIEVTYVDAGGTVHRQVHVDYVQDEDRRQLYRTRLKEAKRAAARGQTAE